MWDSTDGAGQRPENSSAGVVPARGIGGSPPPNGGGSLRVEWALLAFGGSGAAASTARGASGLVASGDVAVVSHEPPRFARLLSPVKTRGAMAVKQEFVANERQDCLVLARDERL